MIRASGDTLLTIINDLLDLSKIESGKLELENRGFNLRACVQDTLNLLAPKAAEKGLELAFLDRLNLPNRISGDETRLRQILSNLLSNAIKFTETGEIVVSVSAHPTEQSWASQPSSEVEPVLYKIQFAVRDTGIGIPADRLDRLFKSFSQVDSSITRQYGGTGLGLAICKKLSELMGGQIWVESRPSQGSTFYFTILASLLPDHSDSGIVSQAPNWIDSGLAQRYPLRILLAEDNKINQKIIRLICEQMGYQVNLVTNGLEVLDSLQQQPYDLILMDVQMPEMDGISATQWICREWAPHIRPRIIAMTASAMRSDRQACLEAGMDDYLSKPIQIHELTQALIRSYELRIQGQKLWVEAQQAEAQRVDEKRIEKKSKQEKSQVSLALFPAVPQLATIDPVALQALQRMVPTDPHRFLAETIEDYLEGAPDLMQAIRTSLDQGDLKTLRRSAHTLCSSSATLGATELSNLCQDLESLAASGRLNAATGQLTRLELEYQRVQIALQQAREKCLDGK
jgi:CheY-like chemotaxis protein